MSLALLRSTERMVALLVGALSIYLGYNLFLNVADFSEGSGTLRLPGIEVVLSQVGPGVFFALFGAIVVWRSIQSQMHYNRKETVSSGAPPASARIDSSAPDGRAASSTNESFDYLGDTGQRRDQQDLATARVALRVDLQKLEAVRQAFEKAGDQPLAVPRELRIDFIIIVDGLKEKLLRTVWDTDWGDQEVFRKLVMTCGEPPKGQEEPYEIYLAR